MYSGQNLDEITLIDMCHKTRFCQFIMRTQSKIRIEVRGINENYKILKRFEFDTERRRMSVVVQNMDTDKVYMFTKGADLSIVNILNEHGEFEESTIENLDSFAAEGLRTMMLAKRELTPEEIANIDELEAEDLEKGMTLLGGTGLEDKL